MESGTEKRAKTGIVLSVHTTKDGGIRLVIDDVIAESDRWPQTWRSRIFVTHTSYEPERFLSAELTDAELAEIGATVVARLAATFNARS